MESSPVVSQEGDAVPLSHADGHGGEMGSRRLPHGFGFQRRPARHRARGVVRAAGISVQGVLQRLEKQKVWLAGFNELCLSHRSSFLSYIMFIQLHL